MYKIAKFQGDKNKKQNKSKLKRKWKQTKRKQKCEIQGIQPLPQSVNFTFFFGFVLYFRSVMYVLRLNLKRSFNFFYSFLVNLMQCTKTNSKGKKSRHFIVKCGCDTFWRKYCGNLEAPKIFAQNTMYTVVSTPLCNIHLNHHKMSTFSCLSLFSLFSCLIYLIT